MEKEDTAAPRRRLAPTRITPEEADQARRNAPWAPEEQRQAARQYHDDMARRAAAERLMAESGVQIVATQASHVDTKVAAMTQRVERTAREHWDDGVDTSFDTHVHLYGELTQASLDLLINETMAIDPARDWFLDIGSGFGKPCFHVALRTGVHCTGIEFMKERVRHARHLQSHMVRDFARELGAKVDFVKQDFFRQVPPLPYTIYYSYDLGWAKDMPMWPEKISELFLLSSKARLLISFLGREHFPRLQHVKSVVCETTGVPPEHYAAHVYVKHPVPERELAIEGERPPKRRRFQACLQCHAPEAKWQCGKCKEATYCSATCQSQHWIEGGHCDACCLCD